MSVINTNISAMKAANASSSANKALGTAMERLSTGKRINSCQGRCRRPRHRHQHDLAGARHEPGHPQRQ